MKITKNSALQLFLLSILFTSGLLFTTNLDSDNWKATKKTFADNISSISLFGIIGTLGVLVLTTTKDGLIKREEDKWNTLSQKYDTQEKMIAEAIKLASEENTKQFDLLRQDFADFTTKNTIMVEAISQKLDQQIDGLNQKLDQQIDGLNERIDTKFDAINKRLDQQTAAIERNTDRLHQYELRQANLEGQVEELSKR